jgi:flagellar biosynthetic protein FlhB
MAEEGGQDESQKTEQPTQKRLDDARKKGQVIFSKEISNFFILSTFAILLLTLAKPLMLSVNDLIYPLIERPHDFMMSDGAIRLLMWHLVGNLGAIMFFPLALAFIAALVSGGVQTGFNIAPERIKPKWEKISIIKGFKRIFSRRNLVEFLKGITKITIVSLIAYYAVEPFFPQLNLLPNYDVTEILKFTDNMAYKILLPILAILFLFAIFDYGYQYLEFMKNLRMSKQDLKDEYKQQEGDPHIKSKLKQIRVEKAKKRMMANVPKADVVITNPTHFAIALQYDSKTMRAPIVLAKGQDIVALRIKEIAEGKKIPIFRNPPLARALFDTAELDKEIPYEHYAAVAKIIGYVYKMKGKVGKKRSIVK